MTWKSKSLKSLKKSRKYLDIKFYPRLVKAGINVKNPFVKFLTEEAVIHIEIYNRLVKKYPDFLISHYPNEGKRTNFEKWLFKLLGGKSGMPDIMIYEPFFDMNLQNYKNGLAIEVKSPSGRLQDSQKECLEKLKKAGWKTAVIRSEAEAMQLASECYNDFTYGEFL